MNAIFIIDINIIKNIFFVIFAAVVFKRFFRAIKLIVGPWERRIPGLWQVMAPRWPGVTVST